MPYHGRNRTYEDYQHVYENEYGDNEDIHPSDGVLRLHAVNEVDELEELVSGQQIRELLPYQLQSILADQYQLSIVTSKK